MLKLLLLFSLSLVLLTPTLTSAQTASASFYIVPFTWYEREVSEGFTERYWAVDPAYEPLGIIDLRSITSRGNRPDKLNTTSCCALIASNLSLDSSEVTFLSDSLRSKPQNLSVISSRLSTPVPTDSQDTSEFFYNLLTAYGDPDGGSNWRPFLPNEHRVAYANLGPIRLFTNKVSRSSENWQRIKETLQYDYENLIIHANSLPQSASSRAKEHALKVAGYWELKYGEDVRSAEQRLRDGSPRKPATTYTESFNQTDSSTVGPDLTWTEVVGNWATRDGSADGNLWTPLNSAGNYIRAEHDVSGTDHYVQITVIARADFDDMGVMLRYSSSANTGYRCVIRNENSNTYLISAITNGTPSDLTPDVDGEFPVSTAPFDMYCEIEGSAIELKEGGTTELMVSDSGITSGTRGGLYTTEASVIFDDFEITDIGITPVTRERTHTVVVN